MKAMFCDKTSDINITISLEEALKLKRNPNFTPIIEAEDKGLVFHLMNSKSPRDMELREPTPPNNHYWIRINEDAYAELIQRHHYGTRYGNSSKVNIHIE
jgi:hypothetical protein